MTFSARAFALWGAASLLLVAGFVAVEAAWCGLAIDALVLGLALFDGVRARRLALAVQREAPAIFHQGEAAPLALVIENPDPEPLTIRAREALSTLLVERPLDFAAAIPGRSRVRLPYSVCPLWRGAGELSPATLRVAGPWRLAWGERRFVEAQPFKVYPKLHLEGDAALAVKHAIERRLGAHETAVRGISTELYALREYLPGDDYRRVHWKATARRRRPVIRENTWEQHQQLVVMVDCGRPMAALDGALGKLDHALAAVIALLRVVVAQGDEATLVLFSKEIRQVVRVDRRTRSFGPLFDRIYRERADLEEPDYQAVAAWCASRVPRRSLAVLLTSVLDLANAAVLERALLGLAQRHLPLLVNLEDPGLIAHASAVPEDLTAAYAKVSALSLTAGNRALAARLAGAGVQVLTTPADRLAFGVVQKYLDLKARRRL
ncbi:MAG: DUF58 domain-containing protein [Acidobacteria bacterium]|jgi:uncharacterized protein (DUF58 family)|nr:DUF58 domain-containing protein [Acidobacteriota bacterium]